MGGRRGGRKPIPTSLHLLQGGRKKTHRPMRTDEPPVKPNIPTCPRHLDKIARTEWKRVIKEIRDVGMICNLDRAILATYCQAYSTWSFATEKVREKGLIILSKDGHPYPNPYWTIINNQEKAMVKAATELGFTPTSRPRVKVPGKQEVDPGEEFLSEGKGRGRK